MALLVGLTGKGVAEDAITLDAVLAKLAPPPSDEALTQIPDLGRKLLALRSYVRYGPKIVDRWSWTKEQIKAFQKSRPSSRHCWPRSQPLTTLHGSQPRLRDSRPRYSA
jgi:hypothetical protein